MITDRQLSILNAIVEDYVDYGQPIGSKTLIDRHNLNVSPATIRNEMKQLEDMNFIEKVHTSSGRSPSELGFRYYVNQLLEQTSHQNSNKIQRLNQLMVENHYDTSSALSYFANELSMMSQYATLVVRPNHNQDIINNIHLIRANTHLVIMVIVFSSGHVENVHLTSELPLTNDELNKISNFLSQQYDEIVKGQIDEIDRFAQDQNEAHFIKQLIKMMNLHISNQSNSIYMGGKVKLIDALNESNVSSIQPILQYIESNRIVELLDDISTSHINVKIGKEIDENLSDISIVTTQYHFDEKLKGQIAVIGPTAMHYQNVIQLLNQIW
ncbi:heat-inducible transcriptional repressor HrcA [Staphylococcus warneri]|uniref:Heat-inducible transcription repressor HrcA n=1 Tax=Staphylococcus warneri TaxID=1292 RepID=A0A2T4PZF0_STAWA|nr:MULTISPECIES: heat-inducible transcriptional repressor HrcA [Staphylococcus]MBE9428360.1 heat-inducible transcription repressor HrcA [Staphylococcus epidermidis]AXV42256.1 heat-inducible transcription repressor HrcA [Staphylococcus sp. M0911]EEQ79349.1 heat-inducible transcription repressor HrcA [Staphylococcus warneri L37603]MBO0378576.1 heat-inducible transcription repressor HrcA [Staphylococcus warneri]MCD8803335.1 heat-inducible transcriptional repressor HrcA [Staphylococcus warneri]